MVFPRVDQLTHELEPGREIGHVHGDGNDYGHQLENAARPPAPSPSLPLPQDRAHAGLAPSLLDAHISSTANSNAELKRIRPPPPLAITLPAKPLLASDPPALTIADGEQHAEWHFVREDSAGGVPATEHTGVGAGYFSPPQTPRSPGASTALPLPTPSAQRVHSRSRSQSRSALISDFAKLTSKVRGPPAKMAKERRSLQSILIPSFLQSLQSPLASASASTSTTPVHVHAFNTTPPTRVRDSEASVVVQPLRPPSSSAGSELRRSYGRARAQTYTSGSRTSIADTIVGVPSDTVEDEGYAYAYATSAMSPGADGRESPPAYLLDDDPFAPVAPARSDKLSRSASIASFSSASDASMPSTPVGASRTLSPTPEQNEPTPSSVPVPLPSASPLHVDTNVSVLTFPLSPLASPPLSPRLQTSAATPARARLPSTGASPISAHPRARPAHTRPAFASRPSLPSLSTLARMSAGFGNLGGFAGFGVKVRKRKGKVGAGLPVEPWDLPESQPEPESESADADSQELGRGRVRERAMTLGEWEGGSDDYASIDDIIFAPNTVGLTNENGNEDDGDHDENGEWEEGGGADPSGGSHRPYSSASTVVQADSFFHLSTDDPYSGIETESVLTERASAPDEREYARSPTSDASPSTVLTDLVDGNFGGQNEEGRIPDRNQDTVVRARDTRDPNLVVPTTMPTDGDGDDDSSLEPAYLRLSASIDDRETIRPVEETETEERVDKEARDGDADANEETASLAKLKSDTLGDRDDDDGVREEDGKTASATSLPEVDGDGAGIKDEAGDGNRDGKGVGGDEVAGDVSTSSMATVRVQSELAGTPENGGRDDVLSESVLPRKEEPRGSGSILIPRGGADDNGLGRNSGGQSATHAEFLDTADAEGKVEEEDHNVGANAFPSPYSYSRSYLHPDGASVPVAIPTGHTRASAIPRHVRRALARSPNSSPSSSLDPSPTSSVEDFGVVLSISPGHFAYAAANAHRDSVRLRPDSLTIDPCLPHPRTPLPSLEQSPQPPVQPLLPLPLPENEESLRAGSVTVTGSDTDFDSIDAARDATDATYIIKRGSGGLEEVSDALASPSSVDASKARVEVEAETETVQKPSESGNVTDVDVDANTDTDIETTATSASGESVQPQIIPLDYFDSGLDDSCMLPPLSTLPEEDPVFSLSPARSPGSVYGYDDYGFGRSPAVSRKASTATTFSSSSAKSNKSYYVANLIGPNSRSSSWTRGRHGYGSSSGSVDYEGVVHADVVAAHKLSSRSQSSFGSGYESVDVRGHARRQGSQSSGISLLSASSRTRYDPFESADELSLGLHEYTGNPRASAARAEAVTRASNAERGFGNDELEHELGDTDLEIPHDVDALLSGWRPFDVEVAGGFEPGSSSGTVRPNQEREQSRAGASRRGSAVRSIVTPPGMAQSAAALGRTHTNGYSGSRGGGARQGWGSGGGGGGHRYQGSYGGSGSGNKSSGSDYGDQRGPPGGGRRGRDDDRDDGRRNRKPSVSSLSTTSSESESESDAYGEDELSPSVPVAPKPVAFPAPVPPAQDEVVAPVFNQLRNGRKGVFKPPPATIQTGGVSLDGGNRTLTQGAEDDDVPLAQRIPNALQAQKSIRRQVRDEREKRRRDRSVALGKPPRTPEDAISPAPFPKQQQPFPEQSERGRTISMKPPKGAALGPGPAALSSSQEAALMAQGLLQPPQVPQSAPVTRRPRAKTIGEANAGGVAAEDLARRLLKVQTRTNTDTDTGVPAYQTGGMSSSQWQPPRTSGELLSGPYSALPLEHAPGSSFSRRSNQGPFTAQAGGQSFQHQQQQLQSATVSTDAPTRTLRPMRSFHNLTSAPSLSAPPPAPPVPASPARRPTSSKGRPSQEQNPLMAKSTRTSLDKASRAIVDDAQYAHHYQQQQPYVQPLSIPASRPSMTSRPESPHRSTFVQSASTAMQTRVYIGDRQHFNVVEVGAEMSARDVLDVLAQQGDLRGEERRSSSWILYEVCADFEMERPIRSFELVNDVFGSWPKEKTMNCLMVKRSAFAPLLTTIPSSIPTRSGYVDYETKKGRWNKRWLELREHGLWLSKREGKDNEFLCSLSAFDAYIVARSQKSQKAFAFAVKSTDPITLFENKSDYLHTFTCPEETGRQWVENILLARSYILYQEKRVLFHNKSSSVGQTVGAPTGAGAALSRAGTRKRPAQTFVNLGQGSQTMSGPSAAQSAGPFEPGSLLAKRSAA